jgi:hypothetical protein
MTNITQKNNSVSNDNNRQQDGKEKSQVIRGNFSSSYEYEYEYKDKEPIFWDVFDELSKDDNNSNCGLVDYENLRSRLISTGKFFAGDAVLMIEHMERTGQIEETGFHLYRRNPVPHNGDGSKL